MIGSQEEFDELDSRQRMENLIRIGSIHELDEAKARVRVESGDVITGWLPWFVSFAGVDRDWTTPSIGEQVMILSPGGDMAQGFVLRGLYQDAHPQPANDKNVRKVQYSDGTVIELNKTEKTLDISVSNNQGKLTVNAAKVVVNSDDINLGGEGGPKVARIGDRVDVGSGSSSGLWPIIEGSNKVKAT